MNLVSDLAKAILRVSPGKFAEACFGSEFHYARHIRFLDERLWKLYNGDLDGLLINMPPRHGKSTLCAVYFPAWWLLQRPNDQIILASVEKTLAVSFGRRIRDVIAEYGVKMSEEEIDQDARAAAYWTLKGRRGAVRCAGVGGMITGHGANLLIIDDPIRNADQALSETQRTNAWEWYLSTAETRMEPNAKQLLIGTRWHEDDLLGRVERQITSGVRGRWEIVRLPALAEENDPLGREVGEALWPERYSKAMLEAMRKRYLRDEYRLGPYWWEAVYQQRPVPKSGGDFQRAWIRYFEVHGNQYVLYDSNNVVEETIPTDKIRMRYATIDLAISKSTTADFCAMAVWAITKDFKLLLVDLIRDRLSGPEQLETLKRLHKQWNLHVIDVEAVAYQLAFVQHAIMQRLPVMPIKVTQDKRARAAAAAALMQEGRVYFRRDAEWLSALENELLRFPVGQHDDCVDCLSLAADRMINFVVPELY